MSDFEIIFTYRETTPDIQLIPFDSKDIICGLVMLDVLPVHALSNGTKTKVAFVTIEAEPVVLEMQKCHLSTTTDLPTTYKRVQNSERFWRDLMSFHETYKARLNSYSRTLIPQR